MQSSNKIDRSVFVISCLNRLDRSRLLSFASESIHASDDLLQLSLSMILLRRNACEIDLECCRRFVFRGVIDIIYCN